MMMFGIVSIGMVVVPMGFQFLAVLGGKALLLAKMALILASIQGLRKITSSPVNYGFYPAYPYERYEKRSHNNWLESANLPGTAPPPLPKYSHWPIDTNVKYDRSLVKASNEADPVVTKLERDTKSDKSLFLSEVTKAIKESGEPRLYPVYSETEPTTSVLSSLHAPNVPIDLTTSPGEVQADYSLDLPYNRIYFQSPTTLIPP
ncbi:hypothetical protein EVAR_54619_1 [Eumeta japonica]|uniref:Uncharacterized protein n=1 Tax=Eumeta variegata TaxID=151549 RepID=A0A4C1YIG0_EUMVA|nr:hypothetical protein EVAR_54619_1 [Eumeta japonica]